MDDATAQDVTNSTPEGDPPTPDPNATPAPEPQEKPSDDSGAANSDGTTETTAHERQPDDDGETGSTSLGNDPSHRF